MAKSCKKVPVENENDITKNILELREKLFKQGKISKNIIAFSGLTKQIFEHKYRDYDHIEVIEEGKFSGSDLLTDVEWRKRLAKKCVEKIKEEV